MTDAGSAPAIAPEDPPAAPPAPGGPPGDRKLPFLAHLIELRNRLRNAAIAYLAAFLLCSFFGESIVTLLALPLIKVWRAHEALLGPMTINYASLIDPFWIQLKLSAIAALFVASPFIFYQLWRFIAPGLYLREKRVVLAVILSSVVFFVGGALFGYFVIFPVGFNFFLGYAKTAMGHVSGAFGFVSYNVGPGWQLRPMLMLDEYASLTVKMLLVFGAVFELPLVVMVLAWLGVVTPRKLLRFEKWAFLLAFILGGLVAPDPVTQACVGVPLFLLYNLAILGSWLLTGRRRRAAST